MSLGRVVWGRGDLAGGLAHARRARALLDPLVAAAPTDTDLRLQLSAANNLLGQISLEEGKIAQALEYHRADLEQFEAAPELERRRPAVRHAISVTYGYLADAQAESADLAGALESRRRSRALRRELERRVPGQCHLCGRWPASRATTRRPRWATGPVGGGARPPSRGLGRGLHGRVQFLPGRRGARRVGPTRGVARVPQAGAPPARARLRVDTASLFIRLATVEDLGRICRAVALLGRPDAPAACVRSSDFATTISVDPSHAFPRAFLAAAWSNMGEAYETMAGRSAAAAEDRRNYRLAARERHRRSHEIWSDLKARGLVSPVDTGRVSAAARALARAERLVAQP